MKKLIALILALVMVACLFTGCGEKFEEITPDPLPAQEEITDPGDKVEYKISGALGSNMVVQRNKEIHVWGWSENYGEYIYGEFMGEKRYAEISEDGEFDLVFSAHPENTKGETMKIYPKNGKTTEFTDVLVGDVWFVTGQSNAEYHTDVTYTYNPETPEEAANTDLIRLYNQTVMYLDGEPTLGDEIHEDVLSTAYCWEKTNSESVGKFSAIGYYFAKGIIEETDDVPLGMVMMAASGRAIRHFVPMDIAQSFGYEAGGTAYNCMMYPFLKMNIRGMLFYQGESDNWECEEGAPDNYNEQLAALIKYFREWYGYDFPFYNCQLSSHAGYLAGPGGWPGLNKIRCEQEEALKEIDNYYLVATYDYGVMSDAEPEMEHPYNKKPVGDRLAYLGLAQFYKPSNYDIDSWQCPDPTAVEWSEDSVLITFDHAGKGLKLREGDELKGFYLLDKDQIILRTTSAEIVGDNQVKVAIKDNVKEDTVYVAYAADFVCPPETHNLVNSNDLPCLAFRLSK